MFQETDGNRGPLQMILHRDHECFGMKRTVRAFDEDAIGEFQRTVEHKQNFVRRAELDDGVLEKNILALALLFAGAQIGVSIATLSAAVTVVLAAAEPDGDPHRSGFGKEPPQSAYHIWLDR